VVAEGFDQHADRYDQHVLGALKYQTRDLLSDDDEFRSVPQP
jgi:predicted TPR repeat methyltransferase